MLTHERGCFGTELACARAVLPRWWPGEWQCTSEQQAGGGSGWVNVARVLPPHILPASSFSSSARSPSPLSCCRGKTMSKRSRRLPLAPVLLLGMPAGRGAGQGVIVSWQQQRRRQRPQQQAACTCVPIRLGRCRASWRTLVGHQSLVSGADHLLERHPQDAAVERGHVHRATRERLAAAAGGGRAGRQWGRSGQQRRRSVRQRWVGRAAAAADKPSFSILLLA